MLYFTVLMALIPTALLWNKFDLEHFYLYACHENKKFQKGIK